MSATPPGFSCQVNDQTDLRLIDHPHADALLALIDANRSHLRPWLPWVEFVKSPAHMQAVVAGCQRQFAENRGIQAGIWFQGHLCGVISQLNVDWTNRTTFLSYWLDAGHQGRGIMTASCGAFVTHAFNIWNLNRVSIGCAVENLRSRAVPERLGFRLEGIIRDAEWLYDRHVDQAYYGLLQSDPRELLEKYAVAQHLPVKTPAGA